MFIHYTYFIIILHIIIISINDIIISTLTKLTTKIKGRVVIFTVKFSNTNIALFLQQRSRIALELFVNAKFVHGDGTIREKYRDERNCSASCTQLYP